MVIVTGRGDVVGAEGEIAFGLGSSRIDAKGRVAVQFTIGGTGKVPSAVVQETTMKDAGVGNCIAQAVRRWTFPKPEGGGSVIVTYPFVLEPG